MSSGSTPLSTTPSSSPYNAYFKRRSFGRPFKDDITCIYEPPSPLSSHSSSPSSSRSPSPAPPIPSTSTTTPNLSSLKGKSKSTSPERDAAQEKERMLKALRREEKRRRREEERRRRPSILTVRMSDGFIWNQLTPAQDLFIPAHIRDRYNTTSSPPTSFGFSHPHSHSYRSSAAAAYGSDYEVECVDIRVEDGEMEGVLHPEALGGIGGKGMDMDMGEGGWEDGMGWELEMELDGEERRA
ncbi:hypothetical protein CALCODRAFT_558430 [Calocera cornea HHB12733]|uniref:Uncharacterized protein n=1 Tax=Calocera cornea HHB12733 TaxID=1353952 RepID=A0A165D0F5_9BASI|nr:hypothetical protein CALCODRAFT_558430 [Calocera cornea HHB12733]